MKIVTVKIKNIYLLILFLIFSSCGQYFFQVPASWSLKGSLESVPETEPHGNLLIDRQSSCIFILVDEKAAFKGSTFKNLQDEFRLSPGNHIIKVQYYEKARHTDIIEKSINIEENKKQVIIVEYDQIGIYIR